jgi:hypothetical protein
VLWASPPCQTVSTLSIFRYWNINGTPTMLVGHRFAARQKRSRRMEAKAGGSVLSFAL